MSIFNRKDKRIIELIGGLFLAFIAIVIGFNMIKTTRMNLKDSARISGLVLDCGVKSKSSIISGRYKVDSDIFFIKLNSSEQIFGVYNKEQNYVDLESKIKYQDSISINFLQSPSNLNIDVLQIEKADNVIYNFDTFKSKERLGGFIALIGGIIMLVVIIYGNFRKNRKKTLQPTNAIANAGLRVR